MHAIKPARPLAAVVTVALAAASGAILLPSTVGAQPAAPKVFFGGQAFGTMVNISSLVQSGKTAAVPYCTSRVGARRVNKIAALTLPGLGTIGAVTMQVGSSRRGPTLSSTSTSATAKTSLLAGMIHVEAIDTQAQQSKTGTRYHATGTTTLIGLSIAGRKMPVHPSVNQTVGIPGLGSIVLNQQQRATRDGSHSITVTALRLTLSSQNMAGVPAGQITIGHAVATLHAPVHHQAYGAAYGTTVQLGSTVSSGPTAPVTLACGGSSGKTVGNKTAGVHLSGALTTAAVSSNARSTDTASTTTATTESRTAGVNLFNGKVRINAITARASVSRNGTHLTRTAAGTTILGLAIDGKKIAAPRMGTTRTVSGLGTLSFDRVIRTSTGLQVYAVRLVLSTAQGNLKQGTIITIGSALAGVRT